MKGGGLTWAGWLMVGVGGLLVYSGMTGQSLVGELQNVLNGRKLTGAAAPTGQAAPAATGSATSIEHDLDQKRAAAQAIPYPVIIPRGQVQGP